MSAWYGTQHMHRGCALQYYQHSGYYIVVHCAILASLSLELFTYSLVYKHHFVFMRRLFTVSVIYNLYLPTSLHDLFLSIKHTDQKCCHCIQCMYIGLYIILNSNICPYVCICSKCMLQVYSENLLHEPKW